MHLQNMSKLHSSTLFYTARTTFSKDHHFIRDASYHWAYVAHSHILVWYCDTAFGQSPAQAQTLVTSLCYPSGNFLSRRSSKGFLILSLKLCVFLFFFASHGIWEDLVAWKILLRGEPMICLQFWEFSNMTQNREVSTFFQRLDFDLDSIYFCLPAKAPPSTCKMKDAKLSLLPKPGCWKIGFR